MATDMAGIIDVSILDTDVSRIDLKFLALVNGSVEKPITENGTVEKGAGLGKKMIHQNSNIIIEIFVRSSSKL